MQHLAGLRLKRVSAQMLVFLLHLAKARQNLVHLVRARGIFQTLLQVFQFVMQIANPSASGDGFIQHRPAAHLLHILAEIADGQPLRNGDLAVVGLLLSNHHTKERGLAGAIGADQADLLAGIQLK